MQQPTIDPAAVLAAILPVGIWRPRRGRDLYDRTQPVGFLYAAARPIRSCGVAAGDGVFLSRGDNPSDHDRNVRHFWGCVRALPRRLFPDMLAGLGALQLADSSWGDAPGGGIEQIGQYLRCAHGMRARAKTPTGAVYLIRPLETASEPVTAASDQAAIEAIIRASGGAA